jgi:hypothetical protein
VAVFDRYVVVDWSANSAPKLGRDSIWIAVRDSGDVRIDNLPTRAAAEDFLVELLLARPDDPTLIGVDFSLGYPTGTAAALGLQGDAWEATWGLLVEQVVDDRRNVNNRFAVAAALNCRLTAGPAPFWGCPRSHATATLPTTKPVDTEVVPQWRHVEQVLRRQGRRPFSAWQLLGAGAVGSQSILGIAMIERLRRRVVDRIEVWPFTTGARRPQVSDGVVVVAEVWPSLIEVEAVDGVVRDAAQVGALAEWLADTDSSGALGDYFSPTLTDRLAAVVTAEEGWVLGVLD